MKTPPKTAARTRIRRPDLASAFSERLARIVTCSGKTLAQLGQELGGFRGDTISKLTTGNSKQIPIDLLVGLSQWVIDNEISLVWLMAGRTDVSERAAIGPPGKSEVDKAASALARTLKEMLLAEARRAGPDAEKAPPRGAYTRAVRSGVLDHLVGAMAKKDLAAPRLAAHEILTGYHTVSAEDVPTSPDWWKSCVPVIGRVAAGDGIDTIEAGEYPPAWAGEFVEHEGGPPTAVAVRVTGESMSPTYCQDDILIVDTARQADSGAVCCVLVAVDGFREARVKRIIRHGGYAVLESINPAWRPERIAADKILAAYAIVAHLPRIPR